MARSTRAVIAFFVVIAMLMAPFVGALDMSLLSHQSDTKDLSSIPITVEPVLVSGPVKAPGDSGFNATEHMGRASVPPTIDGNMTPGEWDDAASYDIGIDGNDVHFFIMYNDTKIYAAFDVPGDTTNDTEGPGGNQLINPAGDYFTLTIDGENDGKITYQAIDSGGNDWPSQMPITEGGLCVDRGAICHGGPGRMAGFWHLNKAGTGNMFFYWTGPGANNNVPTEPFDWLNPGFLYGHRQYEYSIPFTGFGDELNRSIGKKIGITASVNDGRGTASSLVIGKFPFNTTNNNPSGPPYVEFMINGKPRIKMAAPSKTMLLAGDTVTFSDAGSTEPDGEALDYTWDFNYDGITYNNETTGTSVNHKFDTPGNYTVAFRVWDPHGANDMATVNITVLELELPPTLVNTIPVQATNIEEGQQAIFKASFDDPNLGTTTERLHVEWTFDGKSLKAFNTTQNGTTQQLIKANYTGAVSAGTYTLKLKVDDSYNAFGYWTGGVLSTSFEWTITVQNKNRPPMISAYLPTDLNGTISNETTDITFNISKFDPDGETMTVAWYVDGVLKPNSTGNSYNYMTFPDYNSAGAHNIKVVVKDSGVPQLMTSITWNITVKDVNRPPIVQTAKPDIGRKEVDEGTMIHFQVGAIDLDGDTIFYKWFFNGEEVAGETTFEYYFLPDYKMASPNEYDVKVEVSDTKAKTEAVWNILVRDVDQPFLPNIKSPKAGDHYHLSTLVEYDVTGTVDPDGDPLTYLWDTDDGTTKTSTKFSHKYANPGTYEVSLTITSVHIDKVLQQTYYMNITIEASVLEIDSVKTDITETKLDDKVTITVTLKNTGDLKAENLSIDLSLDNGGSVGSVSKQSINTNSTRDFIFIWVANREGKHTFTAKLKTDSPADTVIKKDQGVSNTVEVKKPAFIRVANDMTWILVLILVVVIVVIVLVIVLVRRRSKLKDQKRHAEALDEAEKTKQAPVGGGPSNPPTQYPENPQPPPFQIPPPPPPPQPQVLAPPPPPVPVTIKPAIQPQVKAQAPPKSSELIGDMSDDEVAKLEAEFEEDEKRKAAAKVKPAPRPVAPKVVPPPPPVPPKVVASVVKPMPMAPPPAPVVKAPAKPPMTPPPPDAPKPQKSPILTSWSEKPVDIKRDSMASSIAGDGLAVTSEMAQMAADAGLCPGCGDTVNPEDSHCKVCMTKLAVPKWLQEKRKAEAEAKKKAQPKPEPKKFDGKCPHCGDEVEPDFKTCPSCGMKV